MPQENKNNKTGFSLDIHQPDESVWAKIESHLDFEARLQSCIADLPKREADAELWNKIESGIGIKKRFTLKIKHLSIAASIAAMLILTTVIYQKSLNENALITNNDIHTLTEKEMEQAALLEIRNQCGLHTSICEQSSFKELMQLYEELNTEELELKQAMKQLGDSPEMIQAMVKIENLKSETIQNLIMLIQS